MIWILISPVYFLQGLWLPQTLHRRQQHGSGPAAESPGPLLERSRHPPPLCAAQGLFHVRIMNVKQALLCSRCSSGVKTLCLTASYCNVITPCVTLSLCGLFDQGILRGTIHGPLSPAGTDTF